jgi:hypothetical protein
MPVMNALMHHDDPECRSFPWMRQSSSPLVSAIKEATGRDRETRTDCRQHTTSSDTELTCLPLCKTAPRRERQNSRLRRLRGVILRPRSAPSSSSRSVDLHAIPSPHLDRRSTANGDDPALRRTPISSSLRRKGTTAYRSGSFSLFQSPSAFRVFLIQRLRPDLAGRPPLRPYGRWTRRCPSRALVSYGSRTQKETAHFA